MLKLHSDEFFIIAKNLSLRSLLSLSMTNKRIYNFCSTDKIWLYKIFNEFYEYRLLNIFTERTPKSFYKLLYQLKKLNEFMSSKQYNPFNKHYLLDELYFSKQIDFKFPTDNVYRSQLEYIHIAKEIGCLNNLQHLILNNAHISSFPKECTQLYNLKVLSLSHCRLFELPKNIHLMKNLKELYLNNNSLSQGSKIIGKLTKLEILNLSHNFYFYILTNLNIQKLTNMRVLDLSYNSIVGSSYENDLYFSSPILKLTRLQELYLHYNHFKKLPKDITKLKSLQILTLYNNPFQYVPTNFSRLSSLKELHLPYRLHSLVQELPNFNIIMHG